MGVERQPRDCACNKPLTIASALNVICKTKPISILTQRQDCQACVPAVPTPSRCRQVNMHKALQTSDEDLCSSFFLKHKLGRGAGATLTPDETCRRGQRALRWLIRCHACRPSAPPTIVLYNSTEGPNTYNGYMRITILMIAIFRNELAQLRTPRHRTAAPRVRLLATCERKLQKSLQPHRAQ